MTEARVRDKRTRRRSRIGPAQGFCICLVGVAIVLGGCSRDTGPGLRTFVGSDSATSTSVDPDVSVPTSATAGPSSPPSTDMPVSLDPGELVLSNPAQNVSFSPGITSSQNFGNGRLVLTPAPASATPALPWQQVADMCRTIVGCSELSPITITLALATGGWSGGSVQNGSFVPGLDNTLVYVLSQQLQCIYLNPDANVATTTSTVIPTATCTFLNLVNANTGVFYGGTQFQN